MKMVFMGTPDFAVVSLDRLIRENYEIITVITQPDRPSGRGNRVQSPPVKVRADQAGVRVMQPERIKDKEIIRALEELKPDIIIVVAYGQILPGEILGLPPLGCINVHASLLPKYRGAAPINWSIINGEEQTGITTMYMDKGLDTGDMLLQRTTGIGEHETAGQLHDRLAIMGAELLTETLCKLQKGGITPAAQDNKMATYAPQMDRSTGKVDWVLDARSIYNLIRGTNPWPGCYTLYNGERMKLFSARVLDQHSRGICGEITGMESGGMVVQTGRGRILITEIQMPSSRRMTVDEYVRGNSISMGRILGE